MTTRWERLIAPSCTGENNFRALSIGDAERVDGDSFRDNSERPLDSPENNVA